MVTLAAALAARSLESLFGPYGLRVEWIADGAPIPGSHWGESEAGLVGDCLYIRRDTPVHSALHEACHFICMDSDRREILHTDAGGDDIEECAVCYLQIELAARLAGYSRDRVLEDMDAWGYSFRLGSTREWFQRDAADARAWLEAHALLDGAGRPSGTLFV